MHELATCLGALQHTDVVIPIVATKPDLQAFHADYYLAALEGSSDYDEEVCKSQHEPLLAAVAACNDLCYA